MVITPSCLGIVAIAADVAVVMLLIDWYRRTRNAGFIWLGTAAVVWPATAWCTTLDPLLPDSTTAGELLLVFAYAQVAVGVSLLLVALLYLCRNSESRSGA
jgi:hypothetical protein